MNAGGTGLGFPNLLSLNAMNGIRKVIHTLFPVRVARQLHTLAALASGEKIRDKRPLERRTSVACLLEEQYRTYSADN